MNNDKIPHYNRKSLSCSGVCRATDMTSQLDWLLYSTCGTYSGRCWYSCLEVFCNSLLKCQVLYGMEVVGVQIFKTGLAHPLKIVNIRPSTNGSYFYWSNDTFWQEGSTRKSRNPSWKYSVVWCSWVPACPNTFPNHLLLPWGKMQHGMGLLSPSLSALPFTSLL